MTTSAPEVQPVVEPAVREVPGREPLTAEERLALQSHEETVGRGLRSFMEVGAALLTIRDQRLYRLNYFDFQHYCEQRWGMSRIHAFRLIEATKVSRMLPEGNMPANEAQVRPLTKIRTDEGDLDTGAIVRIWRRVIDRAPTDASGRKIIPARMVEEAVQPVLRRRRTKLAPPLVAADPPSHDPLATPRDGPPIPLDAYPAPKVNITDEQFAELREHVTTLARLMIRETIPENVRMVIEDVCDIVLD